MDQEQDFLSEPDAPVEEPEMAEPIEGEVVDHSDGETQGGGGQPLSQPKQAGKDFAPPDIVRVSDLPSYRWVLSREKEPIIKPSDNVWPFVAVIAAPIREGDHVSASGETIRASELPDLAANGTLSLEIWIIVTGRMWDRGKGLVAGLIQNIERRFPNAVIHRRARTATANIIEAIYDRANNIERQIEQSDSSNEQEEFDQIGAYALEHEVSDIHIEVTREAAQILMRRHGRLNHYRDLSPERAQAICAAAYNTLTEEGSISDAFNVREFQNAVIDRTYEAGRVRFRYASMPVAPEGFNVVLRLLPLGVEAEHKTYEELGYSPDQRKTIRRALGKSSGMFIIAGTTGSGKSTTLQNAIEGIAIERPHHKIRTIEEPVEYNIRNASQTPVVRGKGESGSESGGEDKPFTDAIRAALRNDPDFLMIGEIRDAITARLAIQAAQTGHQVATTLHADSWSGVVDRLGVIGIEMGLLSQPGLISGLAYQKLTPVLCPECKMPLTQWEKTEEAQRPENVEMLERLEQVAGDDKDHIRVSHPDGCPNCQGTGVVGQTICAEVAIPNNAMLRAIREGDIVELRRIWRSTRNPEDHSDMSGRTAFEHAIWKMRNGVTDPRDVEQKFMMLDEVFHIDE
ncbi:GspE/PulE family protein [Thioalkalivibrio sp. ALE23]|uniref:GspE/PulE family protein n=1 Tax=Thioalkalivibrio sp. ALE23 TaxID=1265495 RepID=UPI00036BD6C7|nr:ATPase, T2SS/T4P/T4SS family [Thioalkalivibrio sp. ALE23]